jgi:hypothetical protein
MIQNVIYVFVMNLFFFLNYQKRQMNILKHIKEILIMIIGKENVNVIIVMKNMILIV